MNKELDPNRKFTLKDWWELFKGTLDRNPLVFLGTWGYIFFGWGDD